MKDWEKRYQSKLCSAEEAVKHIKNGDRVLFMGGTMAPEVFLDAMIKNASNYKDVHIMHGISYGKAEYVKPEYRENFVHDSLFAAPATRAYINSGNGDLWPCYYHDVAQWIQDGLLEIDVFMLQVTPPDAHGFCSTGVIADFVPQCMEKAKLILAQVNDQMPWTNGDAVISVENFDFITVGSQPLVELPVKPLTEVEDMIGKYCASLIEDRSTIQLGIGGIPDAVCKSLYGKKDLGVHTEMFSDGVMDLYEAGVITNKYKSFDKGKITTVFLMGSKKLYEFVDKNPVVEVMNAAYVNHPLVIAKCSQMVCINTCIEVDIMGQVVSSTAGTRQISGTGGQMDFMRGAAMSLDGKGKGIVAMSSTREKNGVVSSRIVPFIQEGSAVTLTRQDIDYFVTEYGIAHLKGKSLRERSRELIRIAHPDFRPELEAAFEERYRICCK